MRIFFYIAMLCITSIAFSQQQKTTQTTSINAMLTFGRLGLDCSGRGACSFKTTENREDTNAVATYNKDNTITFIIYRSKITKEDDLKIVGQPLTRDSKVSDLTFVMEDDLILDTYTKSRLHTPLQLTKIPKGNYALSITEDTYTITLILE